ncbi:MAG TPA: Na+/H+ antiporter NhaA [Pilimelia sp.]|nr:Na+/H+ antiporter NhaA [Pilimelia sp.]
MPLPVSRTPITPPAAAEPAHRDRLFARPSWQRAQAVAGALRSETIGGLLLLAGAAVALIWANSPWRGSYDAVTGTTVGPAALHLDLTVGAWAADGLLAIFFFVVGLELRREFVDGELRSPSRAALPIVAALGGMLVPALIYLAVNITVAGGSTAGWAVPTATDIAFAVAVLAIISTHLPAALRSFLLTLAVVDDLLAVMIIAAFFTAELHPLPLGGALVCVAAFALLARRPVARWWLLAPLALLAWALMHASGVHATIAGVLLGFAVPALARPGERASRSERWEHLWRPVSAGFAVPLFALSAAGVTVVGGGLAAAVADPAAVGIVLGLVVGKLVGIVGATYLLARFTRAALDDELSWWDVLGLALLAGIGFTVSLLIGELAFGAGGERDDHVKVAVLAGSVLSAVLASVVLRWRNRVYRRLCEAEERDADLDGVPDVYQR